MRRHAPWLALLLAACAEGDVGVEIEAPEDAALAEDDMRRGGPMFMEPSRDATPLPLDAAAEPSDAQPEASLDAEADAARDEGAPDDLGAPPADMATPVPDMDAPPLDVGSPPPECVPEICDGLDQDCDQVVDEDAVCGPFVASSCALYLGWSDENRHPRGVSPVWGGCPAQDRFRAEDVRCAGTRRDGRFARLDLGGDVNGDDALGLALRCESVEQPELAAWFQSSCAVYLGWADENRGPDAVFAWGACPNAEVSNQGQRRCTSTGFDGNFRALDLDGDVDENDDLGVAWVCRDADGARAQAQTEAVEVFLGSADENRGPADGAETWSTCPGAWQPARGEVRCVGSAGDGRFHRLNLEGDVDSNDALGLAIRAR